MLNSSFVLISGSKISPELNKLNVTVVENDKCKETYGDIIKETNICAVGMEGQGTCQVFMRVQSGSYNRQYIV